MSRRLLVYFRNCVVLGRLGIAFRSRTQSVFFGTVAENNLRLKLGRLLGNGVLGVGGSATHLSGKIEFKLRKSVGYFEWKLCASWGNSSHTTAVRCFRIS